MKRYVILPVNQPDNGFPGEMLDAGTVYLNNCVKSLNHEFILPATFNWHDFIQTMLLACPDKYKVEIE